MMSLRGGASRVNLTISIKTPPEAISHKYLEHRFTNAKTRIKNDDSPQSHRGHRVFLGNFLNTESVF
jgi:hypothetical protein